MKKFYYLTTAIFFAISSPAFSQNWVIHTLSDSIIGAWTRSGDFDQDNDPDIIVQSGDTIYWYENLRPGWVPHLIDPHFYNSVYAFVDVVDIDGDGDLDVLKAPSHEVGNDTITWNENQSNGSAWTTHIIVKTEYVLGTPQAAYGDLDGDGDLDLVFPEYDIDPVTSTGYLYWMENNDNDGTWTKNVLRGGDHWFTILADMDGDDDLDIVSSNDSIFWLENELPATTWTYHHVADGGISMNLFGLCADLNGDNTEDIVTLSFAGTPLVYYTNDSWSVIDIHPTGQIMSLGLPADIDADGDLDMTYAGYGFAVQAMGWAENQNSGATWILHDITDADTLQRFITGIDDIDGDGDDDIVALTFSITTGFGSAIWAENPLITTGISSPANKLLDFDLNPNPTDGNTLLSIQASTHEVFQVQVMDLMGRACATYTTSAGTSLPLDLGELPSGTFIVRVWNENMAGVNKVVKK